MKKIEALKQFKLDAFQKLLKQADDDGLLRPEVHFGILSAILERVSGIFIDTYFLLENGMKATQVIDGVLRLYSTGL